MAGFDPDAYLAKQQPAGFDPDAYLARTRPVTRAGGMEPTADAYQPFTPVQPSEPRPGSMVEFAQRVDAGMPTPRSLAPGVVSLFDSSSPERAAEQQGFASLKSAPSMVEFANRLDAAPQGAMVGALMYAPQGTPQAPVTTVKPPRLLKSPAAAKLQSEGVKSLTVGQMAPDSTLGIIERVSADNPFGLGPQRAAAKQDFIRVAQNKGVAPGDAPPANPDLQARLGDIFKGYGPAYDRFKGAPVDPQVVAELPKAAAMPRRGVDARTAAAVGEEVKNALTVLDKDFGGGPKPAHHGHGAKPAPAAPTLVDQYGTAIPPTPPPPKPPPKATVGDLMKVRENIREQARAASQAQDFDRLRLLEHAEDSVTDAITKSLTPEQAAALQATDRQYARLMTATNAAPAGQTEFTPLQYLKQVEKAAGRRNFKRGEAGDLQDLGEAARTTFADAPMTGVRPGILSALPGMRWLGAPVSRLANSPAGREFLLKPRVSTKTPRPPETFMGLPGEALSADPFVQEMIRAMQGARVRVPVGAADEGEDRK